MILELTNSLGEVKKGERKRNHSRFCEVIPRSVSVNPLPKPQQQQNSPVKTQRPAPMWHVWHPLHQQLEVLKEHGDTVE